MVLLIVDVFCTFSRTLEFIPIKVGPLSLAVAIRCLIFICGVFSGRIFVLLESKIAKALLFFTAWMILGIPFSSWKGGSVDSLVHNWLPAIFAFVGGCTLIYSIGMVRRVVFTLAFSNLIILVLSRIYGGLEESTMRFGVGEGSLGNSNDLATLLLMGLPCMVFYIQDNKGRRWLLRFIMLAAIPVALSVISKTGSRTALITIAVYAAMVLISASGIKRVAIALGLLVGGAIFFMTAPASTLSRYRTILPFLPQAASGTEDVLEESAAASSEARRQLLQQSMEMTIKNPIFGVGVGTFQSAAAKNSKSKNEHESWHESHNTYMQVASELGVPAFIAYMAAIWFSFRCLWQVKQQSRLHPDLLSLNRLANYLLAVLICYCISAFFSSVAYLPMFPFIAAIIDAFQRHAKDQMLSRAPAPVPAAPRMFMGPPVLAR